MVSSKAFLQKKNVVFGIFLFAAAGIVFSLQDWVTFSLREEVAGLESISVVGNSGMPYLLPIFIAIIAIAATLLISGRLPRLFLGVIGLLLSTFVFFNTLRVVLAEPTSLVRFGRESIAEVTGFVSDTPEALYQDTHLEIFAWLTLLVALFLVLLTLIILIFSWLWPVGGKKYEVDRETHPRGTGEADRILDWDTLSHGEDPTTENED